MQNVDRRGMLRCVLGGAAAATTVGITLMADTGEAMPLAREKNPAEKADDLVEEAGWRGPGGWGPGPRPWRRGRRWVCWRNRWGRRVCGWRW